MTTPLQDMQVVGNGEISGALSKNNSSDDTLAAGATFTGSADVVMRITYASTNSMHVAGGYDLVLVQN